MAFRHTRRRLKTGAPVDFEDYNDVLEPFVEEVTGRLDEHNYNEILKTQLEDVPASSHWPARLDRNVAWRTAHDYTEAVAGVVNRRRVPEGADSHSIDANAYAVAYPLQWQPVAEVTIDCPENVMVRVIGGAMWYAAFSDMSPSGQGVGWTLQWGIMLNRAVRGEAINGDLDDGSTSSRSERGYGGRVGSAKVDTLIEVPAGINQLSLVFRVATRGGKPDDNRLAQVIVMNRELVALGLFR